MRLTPLLGVAAAVCVILLGAEFLSPAFIRPAPLAVGAAFSSVATTLPPDEMRDWMAKIETMEMRGDYAALEGLAVTLRNVDVRFAGGEPKITAFYAALGDFAGCGCEVVPVGWTVPRLG